MWMWCQRVPEKNQQINFPFGDPGADLLIAAQRSTLELLNGQAQLFLYQRSRGTGSAQHIIRKNVAMLLHPVNEFPPSCCRGQQERCSFGICSVAT
jgi:hypothetical protein